MAAPGIAVTAIFCLLFAWNEYICVHSHQKFSKNDYRRCWGLLDTARTIMGTTSATATVCVIPMIAFALMLQRYIVRELTFGAFAG